MIIKNGALNILPTDKLFDDSPDAGMPECVCSRCGSKILEGEIAIRAYHKKENKEWRFCEFCVTGEKYFFCVNEFELDMPRCKQQCAECVDLKDSYLF